MAGIRELIGAVLAGSIVAGLVGLVGPGSVAAQVPEPVGPDVVVNGSFELPDIPTGSFGIFASIPGWSHEARPGTTSSGIEVQDHVAGAPATGAGAQFVELDSNGPSRVFQTISTTPGRTYRVTYSYSARPGTAAAQNHFTLTAAAASQEIGPIAGGSQTNWVTATLDFVAAATSTEISFLDLGPEESSGGLGAYIDTVSVQLLNAPPDCSGVAPSKSTVWPPNHRFVTITLAGATDPDGDNVTLVVTGVTQDEAVGANAPDAAAGPTGESVNVRAERDGTGDGRVYRIAYTVTDAAGATCSGVVVVSVAHDRDGEPAVESGEVHDSFGA